MTERRVEDGGAARDDDNAAPPPSARVRLEVDILANGLTTQHRTPLADASAHPQARTVLIVSAVSDLRSYIRQCLWNLPNLLVVEASSVTEALMLSHHEPHLAIVDALQAEIIRSLHTSRVIVIADDDPKVAVPDPDRVHVVPRPFTTEGLRQEVARLLT